MSYKIEKNVPLPADYVPPNPGGKGKYHFAKMKDGDSFFAPGGKLDAIRQNAFKWRGIMPNETKERISFTTIERTEEVDGEEVLGVRFWMHIKEEGAGGEKKNYLP